MVDIPEKYQKLWSLVKEKLNQARDDDLVHAETVVETILNYEGDLKLNYDILIPVAMMHDIGHCLILPEHFKYVTGNQKMKNGKLVHMLVGAKLALELLSKAEYDSEKSKEITEIIAFHDGDQLDEIRPEFYDTENKKIFHDFDSLDRYTEKRINNYIQAGLYSSKEELIELLSKSANKLFIEEIKEEVKTRLEKLRKI